MLKLKFLRIPMGLMALVYFFEGALGAQPALKDEGASIRDQLNEIIFGGENLFELVASTPLISESQTQPNTQSIYYHQLKSIGFGEGIKFSKIDCITQLEQIVAGIRFQNPSDSILVVLDWDNTVSLVNGFTIPFREGALTDAVLRNLDTRYNVQFMILTSRFSGYGPDDGHLPKDSFISSLFSCVNSMHTALPLIRKTPLILKGDMQMGGFAVDNNTAINRFIITDGIVFAGSHTINPMKGPVFVEMMKMNYGLNDFKHIIFVDNEIVYIDSMANSFIHRADKHKLTLVHYPQIPLLVANTAPTLVEGNNPSLVEESK